jgi:hypothetical protein
VFSRSKGGDDSNFSSEFVNTHPPSLVKAFAILFCPCSENDLVELALLRGHQTFVVSEVQPTACLQRFLSKALSFDGHRWCGVASREIGWCKSKYEGGKKGPHDFLPVGQA